MYLKCHKVENSVFAPHFHMHPNYASDGFLVAPDATSSSSVHIYFICPGEGIPEKGEMTIRNHNF